ncbi:hypothetical protein KCP70_18350 [Salmonella enterica subsp. enterica]|nr:hypothetical protein KCP70_18350 [Salmonella enterica subsp. enterica]
MKLRQCARSGETVFTVSTSSGRRESTGAFNPAVGNTMSHNAVGNFLQPAAHPLLSFLHRASRQSSGCHRWRRWR